MNVDVIPSLEINALLSKLYEFEEDGWEKKDWVAECRFAMTRHANLLAVARGSRIALFATERVKASKNNSNTSSDNNNNNSNINSNTLIFEELYYNSTLEIPTSLAFITLSSPQIPLCLAVGYSSGYLRIFTLTGALLLSQIFHKGAIQNLSIKDTAIVGPYILSNSPFPYSTEELTILYPSNVVVNVTGLVLFSVLQVAFLQITRKGELATNPTTFTYRKWLLSGPDIVTGVVSCGNLPPSPFGIFSSSSSSAFSAYYSSPSPFHTEKQSTRFVVVGKNPPLSFYIAGEDHDSSYSTAMTMASTVASKITTTVWGFAKSWWGGKTETKEEPEEPVVKEPTFEPAISLTQKWYLSDPHRNTNTLSLSPNIHLGAATDSYGRVLLIDTVEGFVLRMWKGYRDAQCGWIQYDPTRLDVNTLPQKMTPITSESDTKPDSSSSSSANPQKRNRVAVKTNNSGFDKWDEDLHENETREGGSESESTTKGKHSSEHSSPQTPISLTLFLVIYAPRRGIIEVWRMRHGKRVAIINVGLGCKLLSTNTTSGSSPLDKGKPPNSQCFIIFPNGTIREIIVK